MRVTEIVVPEERRITALLADELDGHESELAVSEAANRLVAMINGILFARNRYRAP